PGDLDILVHCLIGLGADKYTHFSQAFGHHGAAAARDADNDDGARIRRRDARWAVVKGKPVASERCYRVVHDFVCSWYPRVVPKIILARLSSSIRKVDLLTDKGRMAG